MITLTKGAIPAVSVSHTTCRIAQLHGLQRQRTPHLAPAPRMLCVPGLTRAGMERPALRRLDSRTSIVIPTGSCRFTRWHRPFGTGYSVSVWRPCARCRSSADYLDLLGLVAWPLVFRRLTEDAFGALLFMVIGGRRTCVWLFCSAKRWWPTAGSPTRMAACPRFWAASGGCSISIAAASVRLTLPLLPFLTPPARSVGALTSRKTRGPLYPSTVIKSLGAPRSRRAPWMALRDELVKRYLMNMGLGGHSPGSYGPNF